jgi:hypothetical protein
LGWDFWKFRPSDATIGRFFMVDPLSAEYFYNSVYAFQENKFSKDAKVERAQLIKKVMKGGLSIFLTKENQPKR